LSELASFEDRFTMRHVREYPHPIGSVFEAITVDDEINAWLLPIAEVEPRVGGRCAFTWGGPRGAAMEGTVTEFDPPRLVHYQLLGSFMRFELEALDANRTRLVFRHRIEREGVDTLTLWPPDVVFGFDDMVDAIGELLDGARDMDQVRDVIAQCEAGTIDEWMSSRGKEWHDERARMESIYREHIVANCPPEDPTTARQPTAFESAIRGKSEEDITAWADSAGGLEGVCGMVLGEMRNRLRPTRELTIAYDLGFGEPWVFTTSNGNATLSRGEPSSPITRVVMTPVDLLRVVANDVSASDAMTDGRIKIEGDEAELRRFFAMTPRGRGET
jgi:uncharacterized protein YndB with AHSA1/START domain